jgi:hypothetical protein
MWLRNQLPVSLIPASNFAYVADTSNKYGHYLQNVAWLLKPQEMFADTGKKCHQRR